MQDKEDVDVNLFPHFLNMHVESVFYAQFLYAPRMVPVKMTIKITPTL